MKREDVKEGMRVRITKPMGKYGAGVINYPIGTVGEVIEKHPDYCLVQFNFVETGINIKKLIKIVFSCQYDGVAPAEAQSGVEEG